LNDQDPETELFKEVLDKVNSQSIKMYREENKFCIAEINGYME